MFRHNSMLIIHKSIDIETFIGMYEKWLICLTRNNAESMYSVN